jgi:hypothetical protein
MYVPKEENSSTYIELLSFSLAEENLGVPTLLHPVNLLSQASAPFKA